MNEKCFAMDKDGKCNALTTERCCGYGQCGFYKPRWRHQKGQELANMRLRALPAARQVHIAEKYYGGQMPWRRGVRV